MKSSPVSVLHRENWLDQLVEVVESGDHRSLFFASNLLQSRMSLSFPEQLVLSYTRYMLLCLPAMAVPQRILVIGIGAGSLIRFLHHHFPHCIMDAVDSSSRVIDLARGYFQLPNHHRVRVHCQDGQAFLRETSASGQYDLILVDAFDQKGMSETVYTAPFFELCAAVLKEKGVLSCNIWSSDGLRLQNIRNSLESFFPGQLYIPVPERGNIVILAYPQSVPWREFNPSRKDWLRLEEKFALDFRSMLGQARRHNQSFLQRLAAAFSQG